MTIQRLTVDQLQDLYAQHGDLLNEQQQQDLLPFLEFIEQGEGRRRSGNTWEEAA